MKSIIIDLDDTLTVHNSSDSYELKLPNYEVLKKLKEYKELGFEIIIFTARNMLTHKKDVSKINAFTIPIIVDWLNKHEVPFDGIQVGKPFCGKEGFYVDDKAIRPSEFVNNSYNDIKKLLNEK